MEKATNKMQKNRIFQLDLFWEGIRQLRTIGIMSAVIMAFCAIANPVKANLDNLKYWESRMNAHYTGSYFHDYTILRMNPFVFGLTYVVVPLMTLYLFNYLNHRNSCDFYHSIPAKRESQFFSFGASILAWNLAILVESLLLSSICGKLCSTINVTYTDLWKLILTIVAGCIFVFSVIMLAMSVTGTNFNNIALTGMILFVPRVLGLVYTAILTENLPILPENFGRFLLNSSLNVVTGPVFSVFDNTEFQWEYGGIVYTMVLGLLMGAAALFLFTRRKSEKANQSAVSGKLQLIIRLIPAVLFSMIPLAILFEKIIKKEELDNEFWFTVICFYIAAVIVYFLYEMISTKRIRGIFKTAKGLIGLVVFDVVFFAALMISYQVELNTVPTADEVKSVRVELGRGYHNQDYWVDAISQIELDNSELAQLLTGELAQNVQSIKDHNTRQMYENYYRVIQVTFQCNTTKVERQIYMSRLGEEKLISLLLKDERICDAVFTPIPLEQIGNLTIHNLDIPIEAAYEIYAECLAELKELSDSKTLRRLIFDEEIYGEENRYSSIYVTNKDWKSCFLNVNQDTLKTWKHIIEAVNAKNATPLENYLYAAQHPEEFVSEDGIVRHDETLYFEVYSGKSQYTVYVEMELGMDPEYNTFGVTENGMKLLKDIQRELEKIQDINPTDTSKCIIVRRFQHNYGTENKSDTDSHIYPYTAELDELLRILSGDEMEDEVGEKAIGVQSY